MLAVRLLTKSLLVLAWLGLPISLSGKSDAASGHSGISVLTSQQGQAPLTLNLMVISESVQALQRKKPSFKHLCGSMNVRRKVPSKSTCGAAMLIALLNLRMT